ncbi:MAG: CRISPR-associated protein Cas4 [bacterium]
MANEIEYSEAFADSAGFDTEATPMITPSDVIEHLFCPRFTYFTNCLKIDQHEELRYKVLKGREIHERKTKENVEYLRRRIGCVAKELKVYLASPKLRVRGVVDEVLTLTDGSMAPLDYKYTEYRENLFETHRIQSTIYAMLIKETYNKPVNKGFICYVKEGSKLKEVFYKPSDFEYAVRVIDEVFRVIQLGYYPQRTSYHNRCIDCCYRNICV